MVFCKFWTFKGANNKRGLGLNSVSREIKGIYENIYTSAIL